MAVVVLQELSLPGKCVLLEKLLQALVEVSKKTLTLLGILASLGIPASQETLLKALIEEPLKEQALLRKLTLMGKSTSMDTLLKALVEMLALLDSPELRTVPAAYKGTTRGQTQIFQ